jgi:hypothetical protein
LTKFYANGAPLAKGLLDGAGGELSATNPPVFREFNIHFEMDFGALKLFGGG